MATTKKKVSKKKVSKKRTNGLGRGHGKTIDPISQLTEKEKNVMPSRARTNAKIRHDDLRERISGSKTINSIHEATDELIALNTEVKTVKNTKQKPRIVSETLEKAKVRKDILKTVLDTKFRLLAKKLPDLKSLEVVDQEGNNLFTAFVDAVNQNQEGKK